ncbi:hypothetical protein E2C01_049111 [Portunus trituberculatus]|uniref:Uncharacterized protein n=1 Tax=Portunus trituberculatus TaxID=210409 RepID=A0A5B7G4S7_PORTR|nr:hypothetical protein [Portunus trituberculatus]
MLEELDEKDVEGRGGVDTSAVPSHRVSPPMFAYPPLFLDPESEPKPELINKTVRRPPSPGPRQPPHQPPSFPVLTRQHFRQFSVLTAVACLKCLYIGRPVRGRPET